MFVYFLSATLSVLLYMHGFFPIPPRSALDPSSQPRQPSIQKFNRASLIVIDALRLDFITPGLMPFVTEKLHSNGCFIKLSVETPTVTLPRIKALTTGTVPQFIDVVINLASPEILHDSLIHRAYDEGKKIVFYGDDVWLKLFPDKFVRSEGTSSFFVNDFYEVDTNVTRNVNVELNNNDWDVMILHYLGLDHIGHVYGPKSPLIRPKLLEMDAVIQDIYNYALKSGEPFFIFITGDHGMRDSGGHGGSTFTETNVPLIVLGIDCKNDSFTQIDVAVNFNTLLGLDIPSTSIGMLKKSLLQNFTLIEYLEVLRNNVELLETKIGTKFNLSEDENYGQGFFYHEFYLKKLDEDYGAKAVKFYENYAQKMTEKLLKLSIDQNIYSLILSSVLIISILSRIIQNFLTQISNFDYLQQILVIAVIILQYLKFGGKFSIILIMLASVALVQNLSTLKPRKFRFSTDKILVFLLILHPLTFLSSSFLEEEHQFWYFFAGNFCLYQILSNWKNHEWYLLFIGLRFLRTLNQVGDQWASEPDLSDWLLKPESRIFLNIFFSSSLISIAVILTRLENISTRSLLDFIILTLVYVFRFVSNENALLGKLVFLLILMRLIYYNLYLKQNILTTWILLISLLLKPQNLILIPSCAATSSIIKKTFPKSPTVLILSHFWLGMSFFFLHGHDNSLASVDISSGYIGLIDYNPVLVFPQVICHTFALPVLSHLLLLQDSQIDRRKFFIVCLCLRLYVILVVFLVTFIHRHHLFIWSVFAPKIFVEGSLFGAVVVEVCFYYVCCFVNKNF